MPNATRIPVRRSVWIAAAAAVAVAGVPRLGFTQPNGPVVRIGQGPGDPFAQGYYALDGGFFQKAGLTVDFQFFGGGGPIAEALASGTVDFGVSTTIQIANAVSHGIPFAIIAPGCLNTLKAPSGFLIVGKTSGIRSAGDLVGKTVAISQRRSITELALITWLRKHGADPAQVKTLEMPFDAMGAAVERGLVAAAVAVEPAYTTALRTNAVRSFADVYGAVAPAFLLSAWVTTQDYARKNPDVARRFQSVMLDVARWANRHHTESGAILAKYSKIDPAIVSVMVRAEYAEQLRTSDIQPTLDLAVKNGLVDHPMTASDLLVRT